MLFLKPLYSKLPVTEDKTLALFFISTVPMAEMALAFYNLHT